MIDLRKYITDPPETDFAKLLKEVIQRTKADTLEYIGDLTKYDEDVLYSIGLCLASAIGKCFDLEDYGEWGHQHRTTSAFGEINPLVYAIISAFCEQEEFEAYEYQDTTAGYLDMIIHFDGSEYPLWGVPLMKNLETAYREQIDDLEKMIEMEDDGTSGALVAVRIKTSSPVIEEVMDLIGFAKDDDSDGIFYSDVFGSDGAFGYDGLYSGINRHAVELTELLRTSGFAADRRKLTNKAALAADKIGEAIEDGSPRTGAIIKDLMRVKNSKEVIML